MNNKDLEKISKDFEISMPFRLPPYNKKTWGHSLHSLCSYQGKLKPSMAHWLVKSFVPKNGRVLDPIGGVGTIAFEAALQGIDSFSNDMSPFASTIASGKINPPSYSDAEKIWNNLWLKIEATELSDEDISSAEFGLNGKVKDFFHQETLYEILRAKKFFTSNSSWTPHENFIWSSLLHVLHGNRPYALSRTSHPITPFSPRGPFEYKSVYQKVLDRAKRALKDELTEIFLPGTSKFGDFRNLDFSEIGHFDTIITSPPFLGMRFDRPNWLRLWFCGWQEEDFLHKSTGFIERQQLKSIDCYSELMQKCSELLNSEGSLIIHIGSGDSRKRRLDKEIIQISEKYFHLVYDINEDVTDVELHGIKDKGMTTHHHLLVFQKR